MGAFHSRSLRGSTDLAVDRIVLCETGVALKIEGTLDSAAARDLEERFAQALEPIPAHLMLDLGYVDYLSSMGLSAILKTAIKLQRHGSDCRIYDPQRSVRRVLEIAKWDHLVIEASSLPSDSPFAGYVTAHEPSRSERRARSSDPPPRLFTDR